MRDARDLAGAFPRRRTAADVGHAAVLHEGELRALVDDAAIARGENARIGAVDDDLRNRQLAGEWFTARFEIDRAGEALHFGRERLGRVRFAHQLVKRGGARIVGNFGFGLHGLFRERLDHFLGYKNRHCLVGQSSLRLLDGFACAGEGARTLGACKGKGQACGNRCRAGETRFRHLSVNSSG